MIYIRRWNDLEEYGFDLLTGEACALIYRGLFDLSDEALAIVKRTIGAVEIVAPSAYNSRGTYSLLMPYAMLEPIAVFTLFETAKCQHVVIGKTSCGDSIIIGALAGEIEAECRRLSGEKEMLPYNYFRLICGMTVDRILTFPEQRAGITAGLSNVHQMTGRVG